MLLRGAMKERHKKYSKLDNEAPWSKSINDSCFSLLYFWIHFVNFFNQDTCQNIEIDIKQLHIWQNWDFKKNVEKAYNLVGPRHHRQQLLKARQGYCQLWGFSVSWIPETRDGDGHEETPCQEKWNTGKCLSASQVDTCYKSKSLSNSHQYIENQNQWSIFKWNWILLGNL